eukprot:6179856-Pleurochrysis_carterae.AAC.4
MNSIKRQRGQPDRMECLPQRERQHSQQYVSQPDDSIKLAAEGPARRGKRAAGRKKICKGRRSPEAAGTWASNDFQPVYLST